LSANRRENRSIQVEIIAGCSGDELRKGGRMKRLKEYQRGVLVALILCVFVITPGCSKAKEITFIPVPRFEDRTGPYTVPLDEDSKAAIMEFLEKKKLSCIPIGSEKGKSRKEKIETRTAPLNLECYKSLLAKLSQTLVIRDIRRRLKGNEVMVSEAFGRWFMNRMIKDVIDSREGDPNCSGSVVKNKNHLTLALPDGNYWWIFSYDPLKGLKIVSLMVVRLPDF
jgi:hypothetical protein